MTVCLASRLTNGPLVAVVGSERAAITSIHIGTRNDSRLPAGIANLKDRRFLRSSPGFGRSSASLGLALFDQAKEHTRRLFARWSTPGYVSITASRIAIALPGIRIQ